MDLDSLLHHYLGDATDEAALASARERLGIDFGIERDPARRFALWALMHGLGIAPDPATAFKTPRERAAAENYDRLARRVEAH